MRVFIALLSVFFTPVFASAYLVANALPLDGVIKQADVILKVTVLSSEKTADESFKPYPHWTAFSTKMKVLSALKGAVTEKEIHFHHYDEAVTGNEGYMFSPQHYHFIVGESYIIFAKQTQTPGVLRMIWDYHRGIEDQGQILAADDKPLAAGIDVKTAVWNELANLCRSDNIAHVQYGISHLNSMSSTSDRHDGTDDFPRNKVLAILAPLITHKDTAIASVAIACVGSRSPYLSDYSLGWLATVGKGTLIPRGNAKYADKWDNPDGRQQMARLIEVSDKGATPALRASAIRALGLCKDKALLEPLRTWSFDDAAEVRAAAALLWSDFPGDEANAQLTRLAADTSVPVRRAVASAVGFAQAPRLLSLLSGFLTDQDESLRTAAAASLVSFDPKEAGELLKSFRNNPDYHATFIDALALENAKPWLDDLAQIVANNDVPKLQFVSQMPVYTSWQILKAEMDTRTAKELASGKLDQYLDALDHPPDIGSGPFQEMYQFYRDKHLNKRAARFRAEVKKRITGYDIDYYFKRVDGEK